MNQGSASRGGKKDLMIDVGDIDMGDSAPPTSRNGVPQESTGMRVSVPTEALQCRLRNAVYVGAVRCTHTNSSRKLGIFPLVVSPGRSSIGEPDVYFLIELNVETMSSVTGIGRHATIGEGACRYCGPRCYPRTQPRYMSFFLTTRNAGTDRDVTPTSTQRVQNKSPIPLPQPPSWVQQKCQLYSLIQLFEI